MLAVVKVKEVMLKLLLVMMVEDSVCIASLRLKPSVNTKLFAIRKMSIPSSSRKKAKKEKKSY